MRWLVVDSLYDERQRFCSHLESYTRHIHESVEDHAFDVTLERLVRGVVRWLEGTLDVVFALDGFQECAQLAARVHVAQVAAICNPMPWEVRKEDGTPAYDLVLSSIPWMVEEARARGCRAEWMPLAFDTRALVCGMGVQRDIPLLFCGTTGGNHRRRTELLKALGDKVTIAPPTFGRDYFRLLARAQAVFHCGAEWARGSLNAMRVFETMGMGALLIADEPAQETLEYTAGLAARYYLAYRNEDELMARVEVAPRVASTIADFAQREVLTRHTYVQRVPRIVELVRGLL